MMKEQSAAVSPFAALDTRGKMEQWIWWQCQHPQENGVSLAQSLPEKPVEAAKQTSVPQNGPVVMPIHHGQYDAVIRRMHAARRQAGHYIPCTDPL